MISITLEFKKMMKDHKILINMDQITYRDFLKNKEVNSISKIK